MSVPAMLLAAAAIFALLRILTLPVRPACKLVLNTLCGYACLALVNLFCFCTGAVFSLNIVTAVIVGFLGLPGVGLLFLLRVIALA